MLPKFSFFLFFFHYHSNNSLGDSSSGEVSTDGESSTPERRSGLCKPHPLPVSPGSAGAEDGEDSDDKTEAESVSLCEREYVFGDEVVDLNSSSDFAPPEGFFQSEGEPEDEDDVSSWNE